MAKKKDAEVAEPEAQVPAVVAPAQTGVVISAEEQKDIETRWDTTCTTYYERLRSAAKNILQIYWDIGTELKLMTDRPNYYGSHTTNDFAERLKISTETVNGCLRFRKLYSSAQLEAAQQKQLGWRSVCYLLAVTDVEKRL